MFLKSTISLRLLIQRDSKLMLHTSGYCPLDHNERKLHIPKDNIRLAIPQNVAFHLSIARCSMANLIYALQNAKLIALTLSIPALLPLLSPDNPSRKDVKRVFSNCVFHSSNISSKITRLILRWQSQFAQAVGPNYI